MAFELTELSTGSLVGVHSTKDAVLCDVAEAIEHGAPEAVATVALAVDDPTGHTAGVLIAEGTALAEIVLHPRQSAA